MDEVIYEKLLEQRDFYLSILKQLDFQLALESDSDSDKIQKLQTQTIDQLKKIEQELAHLSNKNKPQ